MTTMTPFETLLLKCAPRNKDDAVKGASQRLATIYCDVEFPGLSDRHPVIATILVVEMTKRIADGIVANPTLMSAAEVWFANRVRDRDTTLVVVAKLCEVI